MFSLAEHNYVGCFSFFHLYDNIFLFFSSFGKTLIVAFFLLRFIDILRIYDFFFLLVELYLFKHLKRVREERTAGSRRTIAHWRSSDSRETGRAEVASPSLSSGDQS